MPQEAHVELVLRGPVAVMSHRDDSEMARSIVVTVGAQRFRIPLPAEGCKELSEALAVSDEELAAMTERQRKSDSLVLPPGALNGAPLTRPG
jgi:hypothetical protein